MQQIFRIIAIPTRAPVLLEKRVKNSLHCFHPSLPVEKYDEWDVVGHGRESRLEVNEVQNAD